MKQHIIHLKEKKHITEEEKMQELIGGAIENLQKANKFYKELESYHSPNMNFDGVNNRLEEVITEIEEWGNIIRVS